MLVLALLLITILTLVASQTDGNPNSMAGVNMDYKIHVDPGKEDCFYQYVVPGATFYTSFQVLRGGDGMAGFAVRHPNGNHVHPYMWKAESEYEEKQSVGGYYEICVDNQFSKFASKLVNLYITTFEPEKWEKFNQELEALDLDIQNFTRTLRGVEERLREMNRYQQISRAHENRDFNTLRGNEQYVGYWSLSQCVVIILAGTMQVYFIRKLFSSDIHKGRPRI